jgi:methyl-accepting chemotaxis protein
LAKELAAVHNASELIHRLSRQVRFLGLHTAILANRFGSGELDGFSRVASEIGQLNHQTLEAGQRVSEVSEHLKTCVEELVKLAQGESGLARSLAPKISRAKSALTDLEKLLERRDQYVISNSSLEDRSEDTLIQGRIQKSKPITNKVLEPDMSSEYRDLQNLIRQAEQNLEQSKRNTRFEWNLP